MTTLGTPPVQPGQSEQRPTGIPVSAAEVVALQQVRDFPCVSLLMSTTPAPQMMLTDQTRLEDLRDQAVLRLRRLAARAPVSGLIAQLNRLTSQVKQEQSSHGLALFVSGGAARAVRLGVPAVNRVVLDATFATRDLVLSLQRTPRHVVLLLGWKEARLFEAVNGVLSPAGTTRFPLRASRRRPVSTSQREDSEAALASFLAAVDAQLGTYRRLHPSPLVLVGPVEVLATFIGLAQHVSRLAGTLLGDFADADLDELAALTRPVIRRYLASREQEALELLAVRTAERRVASGMEASWLSARTEQPEMLAVEEGLFYPARLSPDGHSIALDPDVDEPGVIDDAVDELVEHVLLRGGWVAFVGDGALARHQGVALTRR
jgi:hypothetical protein